MFYIDLVRAISVLLIITYHFNQQIGAHGIHAAEIFKQTFASENIGSLGITLFIILSGAALMASYGRTLELRTYARKRFLAIFPLYWTGFLVTAATLFLLHGHLRGDSAHWKFLLTIIGFDGFLYYRIPNYYLLGEWFIGFILLLYLGFPLLRKALKQQPLLLCIGVLALYVSITTFYNELFVIDIVHNPLTRLPDFVFGMMFVAYVKRVSQSALLLAIVVFGVPLVWHLPIPHIYVAFLMGMSAFATLAFIAQKIETNARVNGGIAFISKYSFPAFLVHHNIIGELLVRFMNTSLGRVEVYFLYLIVLILTFSAAVLLTRLTNTVTRGFKPSAASQQA